MFFAMYLLLKPYPVVPLFFALIFCRFVHEANVLTNNAAVILSSLGELDPNFFVCIGYNQTSDFSQASRVAEFLLPEGFANTFSQHMVDAANPHSGDATEAGPHRDAGWYMMSNRLQSKIDQIERGLC